MQTQLDLHQQSSERVCALKNFQLAILERIIQPAEWLLRRHIFAALGIKNDGPRRQALSDDRILEVIELGKKCLQDFSIAWEPCTKL
jgi:hypothetical protein